MGAGVLAPAKVNLYLHVVGRRADGYHLLDSLVASPISGTGSRQSPADRLSLAVGGPEAAALAGLGDDNLVLRAARLYIDAAREAGGAARGGAVSRQAPADRVGDRRRIERRGGDIAPSRLSVGRRGCSCGAGGTGGAARRRCAGLPAGAAGLGRRRRRTAGAGRKSPGFRHRAGQPADRAADPSGVSRPPRAVFRARPVCRDAARRRRAGRGAGVPPQRSDRGGARLVPEIAAVLELLAGLPGALLARMSGSGATCFALFADRAAALAAHAALERAKPDWWSGAGALLTEAPPIEELARPGGMPAG